MLHFPVLKPRKESILFDLSDRVEGQLDQSIMKTVKMVIKWENYVQQKYSGVKKSKL